MVAIIQSTISTMSFAESQLLFHSRTDSGSMWSLTSSAPIQIPHSFFVKLVIGLLITVSHLLHFIFCQKNAPLHTPSTKIQECPRAGLQIKSARIPIFSDLTIEILTLTFPTQWQKRAVIHLIFYFYNIYNQFCPECNKIVFNKIL